MGTQLNIKDHHTVVLARALATELRQTVTDTIREALEEKKRRRDEEIAAGVRDVLAIAIGSRALWEPTMEGITSKQIMDSIYDENGSPR